jgi:hypothetical protein
MFEPFWNSLESVSRVLNWTQLALVTFGVIAIVLSAAQYNLGVRKDILSGNSQKQKELVLNQKVAQASNDATQSMTQLAITKASLAETQQQFTVVAKDAASAAEKLSNAQQNLEISQKQLSVATADAKVHLEDYLAAREKVSALERRAQKVVTLQLRVEVVVLLPPEQKPTMNTNVAMNIVAALVKKDPTPNSILFRSGEVREIPIDANKVRYTCILDPDSPLSVSGIDVSALDNQDSIETNFIQFLAPKLKQAGTVGLSMQWTVILNGASFPISANQLPPAALYDLQIVGIRIPEDDRSISKNYDLLVR